MQFLVVLTSVAAFLTKGIDGLYLVKKQESVSVVSPDREWSEKYGSGGSGSGLLQRAPVENLAPLPAPGPAVVILDINVIKVVSNVFNLANRY